MMSYAFYIIITGLGALALAVYAWRLRVSRTQETTAHRQTRHEQIWREAALRYDRMIGLAEKVQSVDDGLMEITIRFRRDQAPIIFQLSELHEANTQLTGSLLHGQCVQLSAVINTATLRRAQQSSEHIPELLTFTRKEWGWDSFCTVLDILGSKLIQIHHLDHGSPLIASSTEAAVQSMQKISLSFIDQVRLLKYLEAMRSRFTEEKWQTLISQMIERFNLQEIQKSAASAVR